MQCRFELPLENELPQLTLATTDGSQGALKPVALSAKSRADAKTLEAHGGRFVVPLVDRQESIDPVDVCAGDVLRLRHHEEVKIRQGR